MNHWKCLKNFNIEEQNELIVVLNIFWLRIGDMRPKFLFS